jgi:hypothetical protein
MASPIRDIDDAIADNSFARTRTGKSSIIDRGLKWAADKGEAGLTSLKTKIGVDENSDAERKAAADTMTTKSVINLTSDPVEGSSMPSINVIQDLAGSSGTVPFAAYLIKSSPPIKPVVEDKKNKASSGFAIRRPILGMVEKTNAPASLFLSTGSQWKQGKDGTAQIVNPEDLYKKGPENLFDSLKGPGAQASVTFNFLMQNISQTYTENMQMIQTFGKTYFFFFGHRPTTLSVQGILPNTQDFNWRNDFLANYLTHLRGTKAALKDREVTLAYDDLFLSGYIINLNITETAEWRDLANFAFDMIVTRVTIAPPYHLSGKTPHDYESNPRRTETRDALGNVSSSNVEGLTQEYWEYLGPLGPTTKDGRPPAKKTIYIYTSFADALSRYIGFNYSSITRIKTYINLLRTGDKKALQQLLLVQWSTSAKRRGANVFELGRIATTKPSILL